MSDRKQPCRFKVTNADGSTVLVDGRFAEVQDGHLLIKGVEGSYFAVHIVLTKGFAPGAWKKFEKCHPNA